MNFEILPYIGVGLIKFGMPQVEVRKLLLGNHRQDFSRTSESISDYYSEIGVFIYYDKDKTVEALEFHEPATISLMGSQLLFMKGKDSYKLIRELDRDIMIDDDGLTSYLLGVGFYAPNFEEDNSLPIESVIVFKRGYYSN